MDERQSLVHDPERLKKRMRLFEAICLTSLTVRSADHIAEVILTSDKPPEPFADQLKKLLVPYPNIHPAFLPPVPVQEAFYSAIANPDVRTSASLRSRVIVIKSFISRS